MRRRFGTFLVALLLLLWMAPAPPAFAQEDDLRQEIEALKKGQEQIRKQLEEIKTLLAKGAKPVAAGPNIKDLVFEIGDNPVVGDRTAKLTIMEFTDYQ